MGLLMRRPVLLAAFLWLAPCLLPAQQRPTPEQAQQLLRARPDLVAQLRQRIMTSGLSPEQIRARLRAEGYPENLLDAYLPGGTSADSTAAAPGRDVLSAVRALGIVSGDDASLLERMMGGGGDSTATSRRQRENLQPDTAAARPGPIYPIDGSTLFGLDVFRASTSQFEPNLAGPVDATYRIGPGDKLVLILTGDVEEAHQLDVTREGFVVIPQVGQVSVANLTMAELENVLYNRLGRVYSGVRRGPGATTRFSVSVSQLRSNQIFVTGDVARPGSYRVSSAGTALSALYAAGGPSDNGTLRAVQIKRGGQTAGTLDVYDYLLRGDASQDVRLQNGDIVFVPVHGGRVRVSGSVVRPATYELKAGETLADAIRDAGGFRATASRRRVQIDRIVPPTERAGLGRERMVIDIESPELATGTGPAFPLAPGDVVFVFAIPEREGNRVQVEGNVWTPGRVGFTPGLTLAQALRRAGGLKPDTYLGQVLISRLQADSTRIQLRATLRDTSGATVTDLTLQEEDQIQVFSVTEFRPERYVAVSGAVQKPGQYAYTVGMTMRDLVLLAGGVQQSALLTEAEVARLPADRTGGTTAMTVRVPLDSTYLFERAADGTYLGPPGVAAPLGRAPEVTLRPYDHLLILRQPEWQLLRRVSISGEVRYPGVYSLRNKNERLRDLIERAGGLTAEAYAQGIRFYRKHDAGGRTVEAIARAGDTTARGETGTDPIGLDLANVLRSPRHRDNLLLEDGDSIYLPRYSPVVAVTGAVNSPLAVAYVPGRDIDYYIRAAGGGNRRADEGRAYVRQANGTIESRRRFLFIKESPKPRAGAQVFVPERDPADKRDWLAVTGSIAQILASLVAIVAIARR
jgi:polysaccharide export outer membrane protein